MTCIRALVTILGLLAVAAGPPNSGVALRDDVLRAEPFRDAKTVGDLVQGTQVTIVRRTGGWYQVTVGKSRGWVRMLTIRRGEARRIDPAMEAGGLAALSSGRGGTGRIVSTTGVRGLGEAELRAAEFDETELRKAQSFAVSRADAQAFAAKGKLKARRLEYLPPPGD